jgi:hypothetical protein
MNGQRKNIVQPVDWWIAFEAAAKTEKLSLSAWIGERCRQGLGELSQRPGRGRPGKAIDSEELTE